MGFALAASIREPRRNQAERDEMAPSPTYDEQLYEPPRMPMSVFLRQWAHTPTAVAPAVPFFGANFVALVFLTWMPTFLNEKFGLNVAKAGLGATVFIQIASLVGATVDGILADRLRRTHAGGRILVQGLGAMLGAPFIFACG